MAYSTEILDRALQRNREENENRRQKTLTNVFQTLEKLSGFISFQNAYIFGSLVKPFMFGKFSDIDLGFYGLRDEDFFKVMSFISSETGLETDILQMQGHRLEQKIIKEGVQWKRKN